MLAYVLGALLLLIVGVYAYASARLNRTLGKRYTLATAALPAPDSTSALRGAHLAEVLGCGSCHGSDLGGKLMADVPPFRLESINLTRGTGGVGEGMTPAVFEHAVRHGVGHDGRPLMMMPDYAALSDADVVALHTYLAARAPVNRPSGGVVLKPLGKVIFGLGGLADFSEARFAGAKTFRATAPDSAGAEQGDYLAHLTCIHCHGADFKGMQPPDPGSPPSPSLDPASRWSEAQFMAALREGKRPTGPVLDSAYMPWQAFRHMTDAEVLSLHAYLKQHFAPAGG